MACERKIVGTARLQVCSRCVISASGRKSRLHGETGLTIVFSLRARGRRTAERRTFGVGRSPKRPKTLADPVPDQGNTGAPQFACDSALAVWHLGRTDLRGGADLSFRGITRSPSLPLRRRTLRRRLDYRGGPCGAFVSQDEGESRKGRGARRRAGATEGPAHDRPHEGRCFETFSLMGLSHRGYLWLQARVRGAANRAALDVARDLRIFGRVPSRRIDRRIRVDQPRAPRRRGGDGIRRNYGRYQQFGNTAG